MIAGQIAPARSSTPPSSSTAPTATRTPRSRPCAALPASPRSSSTRSSWGRRTCCSCCARNGSLRRSTRSTPPSTWPWLTAPRSPSSPASGWACSATRCSTIPCVAWVLLVEIVGVSREVERRRRHIAGRYAELDLVVLRDGVRGPRRTHARRRGTAEHARRDGPGRGGVRSDHRPGARRRSHARRRPRRDAHPALPARDGAAGDHLALTRCRCAVAWHGHVTPVGCEHRRA